MDELIERLNVCANDPMWCEHAEVQKSLLREAVAALEAAREDAERLDWLAEGFRTCTVYMSGSHPWVPGHKVRSLHGPNFRAAIDQARGKAEAGQGGGE